MTDDNLDTQGELIVPEKRNDKLTSKRGLDLGKVDMIMGREQERDLALIYRADQLQLFIDMPSDDKRQYHYKRKPSDAPLIQAAWEAHKNYLCFKDTDDTKAALSWYKELVDIINKIQDLRREAMDRLLSWKKQAEAEGRGLGNLSSEDLEKLAHGS